MSLRILRGFLLIVMAAALYAAYDQYTAREAILSEIAAEMPAYNAVRQEMDQLSKLPTKTLRPADEALEELCGRLIDDTDLLGSTVKISLPPHGIQWQEVKHGVTKTTVSFESSADKNAGLSYFSMVWQLLQRQPVRVVEAFIKQDKELVHVGITVELLALQGG